LPFSAPTEVQAQLVIPGTTGTEACRQGGWPEIRSAELSLSNKPTQNGLTFTLPQITINQIKSWAGGISLSTTSVAIAVQENGNGSSRMQETTFLGISSSKPVASQSITFSSLKKNTRYVVSLYRISAPASPLIRRCFKTRGEFSNAEQNLNDDGTLNFTDPLGGSRHGCFAVTRTPQDFKECMCWGTRGGTRFSTTTATRTALGCQDSS